MKQSIVLCLSGLSLAVFGIGQFSSQTLFLNDNSRNNTIAEKSLSNQTATLQAKKRGNPWINLQDGTDQIFTYSGDPEARQIIENSEATPKAMASADFDEDGVPDLVAGYASSYGGILTIHHGNIDSIFPNAPEAAQRKTEGKFVDAPFLPEANVVLLPESTDYLGAGDFDADGHWDVLTAAHRSSLLYFLRGDGHGGFNAPEQIVLVGVITSFATGEINRADGLTDVAIGVVTPDGARLLVFEGPEGAMTGEPERFSLPAQANAFSIGQLDDEYTMDLAIGAGSELLIIHGRDRKLSLDESQRNKVPPAVISQYSFESTITSTALGDFTGKRRKEIAMLLSNGELKVVSLKKGKSNQLRQKNLLLPDNWSESSSLIRAKISSLPQDDLVFVDKTNSQLHILSGEKEKEHTERVAISLDTDNKLAAVLPMQLNVDALQDLVVLKHGQNNLTVALTAPMSTFVVNSNGDESDCNVNDGICSLGTINQGQCVLTNVCTLRAAIQQANANVGLDSISFSIGSGVQTITPLSYLPGIENSPVIIDGTTQSGFLGAPLIELNGTNAGQNAYGLVIGTNNCTIKGLVINRFGDSGILLFGGSSNITGTIVQGNFIGTDRNGTADLGNSRDGVYIIGSNNTIGGTTIAARNIISGNNVGGVFIPATVNDTGNIVQGNFIGTDVTGTADLGNSGIGLRISAANNTLGGTSAGTRNIISGNDYRGIDISNSIGGGNIIQGNYIGTDVTGTIDLGNASDGVYITQPNNTIGGTSAGARNIISGNDANGVYILGYTGHTVQGNYIGTDLTGTLDLGNGFDGVFLHNSSNNTVGGITGGSRNIISGNNANGIEIFGYPSAPTLGYHQIFGNYIGTKADGLGALGNSGHGIFVTFSASNNTIGGVSPENCNRIQNNGGDGVYIDSGTGNGIAGNSIFGNAGLGIDLGANGITPNDTGDGDSGANNLQNFPVLTAVYSSGSSTTIQGTLNSSPNTAYTLRFYSNSQCDTSGNGEGQSFLGSSTVMTDGSGNRNLNNISLPVGVAPGQFVTATATDPDNNTSEFSQCRVVILRYKLTVHFAGLGAGRVTVFPMGTICDGVGDCEIFFDTVTFVRLEASPNGFESIFSKWMQDCTGSNPSCQLTMNQDKEVTAEFVRIGFEDRTQISQAYLNALMSLKWRQIPVMPTVPTRQELSKNGNTNRLSTSLIATIDNVKIELSRNGGATFETIFASTPNDGAECWQVTAPTTTQALIRISSIDNPSINGISAHPFEIISSPGSGAITPGPANCGGLTAGDGRSPIRGNSFYADRYTFSGTVGQQIAVSLESADFDTYLYLVNPGNSVIAQDDNGSGGTNSRIPSGSSFFTLPSSGIYTIEATSALPNATGNYILTLSEPCPYSLSSTSQAFPFTGGSGSTNITAANICDWSATSNMNWITVTSGSNNSGNGMVGFTVATNTSNFLRIGAINVNGQILTITQSAQNPVSKVPFDFDGDGKTDISIFRPAPAEWWYSRSSDGQVPAAQFGASTDRLTPGDFTGDGKTDIAVWRPSTGFWFILRSEDGSFFSFPFGTSGDIPAPSDYDGDGKTDAAVFRPSVATWFILRSSDGGTTISTFGALGDKPVVADYDGDGRSDIAIWRPGVGEWWYAKSSNGQTVALQFGTSSDKPVQGDYTGDGRGDIAFFRPSTGFWFILRSEDNSFFSSPFGTTNDLPAPGDYDGDGKFDTAVFRPSSSTWFVNRSTAGVLITTFGTTGDQPVPTAFVP